MSKAIGILGGTFDPIHNGHLAIATAALTELNLAEIQFIPCNLPPHRDAPKTTVQQRVEMVKLAIQDQPKFVLNTLELQRPGPSYSIDTLIALQDKNSKLFFIVGADSYLSLSKWHRADEITDYCTLVVYNRPGYKLPENAANAVILSMPPCAVSATEIRATIHRHDSVETLLPPKVWEYIQNHQIYTRSHA